MRTRPASTDCRSCAVAKRERIGLDVVGVRSKFGRDVRQQVARFGESVSHQLQSRIVLGDPLQPGSGARDKSDGVGNVVARWIT